MQIPMVFPHCGLLQPLAERVRPVAPRLLRAENQDVRRRRYPYFHVRIKTNRERGGRINPAGRPAFRTCWKKESIGTARPPVSSVRAAIRKLTAEYGSDTWSMDSSVR